MILLVWAIWAIKKQLIPCLCVQLGLSGTLHSLFLEASPRAKHLVIEIKTSRGKAKRAIFSYQYLPIS